MKFLCDRMLGTCAKWLRIYGFDTFFARNDTSDEELIEIAKKEDRVLVTRDKNLTFTARRENIKVIEIKVIDIDEQIKKVIDRMKGKDQGLLDVAHFKNAAGKELEVYHSYLFLATTQAISSSLNTMYSMMGQDSSQTKLPPARSGVFVGFKADKDNLNIKIRLPTTHLEELGTAIKTLMQAGAN